MIAYKFLRADGFAVFSGHVWPRPTPEASGAWVEASAGPLGSCRNGVHAAAIDQLAYWIGDELWEVELEGELQHAPQGLLARRGRLLRRVGAWNATAAIELGRQCEARVRSRFASAGEGVSPLAQGYARETSGFVERGAGVVAAYAAALAVAALAGEAGMDAAYHEERREQSLMLAALLGLA